MRKLFYRSRKSKASMVARAVKYILSANLEKIKTLTAEDVAAEVDKNLMFLSFIFRIVQKISIANFILREKLYRAYEILENDQEISILKLSDKLGFPEAELFEEEFEKYYAIKPILFQELKGRKKNFGKKKIKSFNTLFEQLREVV